MPGGAPHICPACRRIADNQPAGILTLSGTSLASHKAEILNLIRHKEEVETADYTLNRIMGIEEQDGIVVVTMTDIHLPRRIGEALKRAFRGQLELHSEQDGTSCERPGAETGRPNDAIRSTSGTPASPLIHVNMAAASPAYTGGAGWPQTLDAPSG